MVVVFVELELRDVDEDGIEDTWEGEEEEEENWANTTVFFTQLLSIWYAGEIVWLLLLIVWTDNDGGVDLFNWWWMDCWLWLFVVCVVVDVDVDDDDDDADEPGEPGSELGGVGGIYLDVVVVVVDGDDDDDDDDDNDNCDLIDDVGVENVFVYIDVVVIVVPNDDDPYCCWL